jgi:tagatose 6-phosphate kinase
VIVVVCLNPALDVTHHVDAVDWGGVNRPRAVRARPGGKGLNVARTLHALGVDVLVLGLAGGITGAGVEAALRERCVPAAFTPVAGETRRTFSVVDGSVAGRGVTAFYEAGPEVGEEELTRFRRGYEQALEGATAVVLSGSLPPGLEAGTYATLIEAAAAADVPAVLDTHGEALRRGAAAGPAIVKPNLAELVALAGQPLAPAAGGPADGAPDGPADGAPDGAADLATAAAAAGQLRGAQAVVITLGPDGLLAATEDGCWRARPPAAVPGNATGAGDAVAAALAHGLVLGRPWDERLRHAAALGAATAAAPVAGEFRRQDYLGALSAVTVEEVR